MIAERIDDAEWPATISVVGDWYGLRIETDHGSEVRYVRPWDPWAYEPLPPERLCAAVDLMDLPCAHGTDGARRDFRICSVCVWERHRPDPPRGQPTALDGGATCEAA